MAILFAANELESFSRTSATDIVPDATEAGSFRSALTRHAIRVSNLQDLRADFTATGELWVHFSVFSNTWANFAQDDYMFRLLNGDTTHLRLDGDNGLIALEYAPNGSSFTQIGTNFAPTESVLLNFDIYIRPGASGRIEFYIDGSLIGGTDVDTTTWDNETFDNIRLTQMEASTSATYYMWFSEIIVADESTIGWNLKTLGPEADGTTSDWTGTFADVDEEDPNDTDFVSSGTSGQVELFNPPAGGSEFDGKSIKALVIGGRAQADGAGPLNIQAAVRTNATNYFSSNLSVTTSFASAQAIFATNPDTTNAWVKAEIDAIEYGFRSQT